MAGGLMQLVAYGAQDVYLTGNPKVTFFQAVYKRHTNFAMETIEQTMNGTAASSGRVSITVARNGDLIGDMFLEATTVTSGGMSNKSDDTNKDTNWIAERIVSTAELSIGGQRIDKHYQRWWRLYSELYLNEGSKLNYAKMTTNPDGGVANKVYLPLIFFFNRNPGLALPLIALQYHEVRIDIDLSSEYETHVTGLKVWGNYMYLDTEERRRFAQKGHEYLIEQVQHTGTDALEASGTKQVRLSYNHPVKELVWCVTDGVSTTQDLWNLGTFLATSEVTVASGQLTDSNCVAVTTSTSGAPQFITGDLGGSKDYVEEVVGALNTAKLVLNGQDRFKEQSAKYFNQVQPYAHHSGSPCAGVYSYSFALKPEEHQPTGTCNFSRIDNAQMSITCRAKQGRTALALQMFAVNYNVLRVQSGMGGLAFSN
jgi:hypothetical protein